MFTKYSMNFSYTSQPFLNLVCSLINSSRHGTLSRDDMGHFQSEIFKSSGWFSILSSLL